ncbi:MAG: Ger(x)C family spore germination protein [Clostridiaceae bacterium]
MKRTLLILEIFILTFFLTGCKGAKFELNDLAVVVATGFDLTPDNNYIFTAQVITPQKGNSFQSPDSILIGKRLTNDVVVYKEVGATPRLAIDNLSSKLGKKLFFGHGKYMVLGEMLARNGLPFFMDSALRGYDARPNNIMLVTKGTAEDILNAVTAFNNIPANSIERLIKAQSSRGYTYLTTRMDFANFLISKTSNPIIGVIDLTYDNNNETNFKMTDTAIFKKDKLIGYLNATETRGLQFIKNKITGGTILTYSPNNNKITFQILKSKSELIPKVENDILSIDIIISLESDIVELEEVIDPMSEFRVMDELSKLQQKEIEKEVRLALNKAQKEFKADIFEFGESFNRKYSSALGDILNNWDTNYPNIKVNLTVNSSVKKPGIISKPIAE